MHAIDASVLAQIDVNLLVALDVLLAERSVSRAARRLCLSQPALSHCLARLRDLFDDPLLVRSGRQMVPTPRAEALTVPLREALSQLALLPRLSNRLAAQAPDLRLVSIPYLHEVGALVDGAADLLIGMPRGPGNAHERGLFEQPFICLVRRDHPAARQTLTMEAYAALSHAVVSPIGHAGGFVDSALAEHGLSRRVRFTTPQLLSAALAVVSSEMILTVPRVVARMILPMLPVVELAPPVRLPPYPLSMSWHAQRDTDPLHVWIREQVIVSAQQAASEDGQ